jgi:mitogen-activated protein kinase 1/3
MRVPFNKVIPTADPHACDLLTKLLTFDPEKRLSVVNALQHPYLEELHYEDDEPVCDSLDMQDFYFEYLKVSREDFQDLTRQEIFCNYPEDTFQGDEPQVQFAKSTTRSKRRSRRNSFP